MSRIVIDRDEMENVEWQDIPQTPAQRTASTGKRRLLITTDNFLPRWDGIARFLSEMIPRLRESYDVTVVAPDFGHVDIPGVTVVRIPLSGGSWGDYRPSRFCYRRILALARRHDVIFNQALGPIGMSAILAAKRARRPIASYIHSIEWELLPRALVDLGPIRGSLLPLSKRIIRFFYNRCTVLVMPSENIAELFSWSRIKTQKRIVHLGVDTKKFTPGDRRTARERLGLPQDAFIVGYHGRIGHEKNLLVLARAFRQLRANNKRLVIVGGGVPELVRRLGAAPDVTVTGSTDNVVPWLHAMDVYVQPSLTETTSLTVLEAMACGLPVVSSRVGFVKHYIKDNQNGLFFDNQSAYDLTKKLQRLHDDRMLRVKLCVEARKTPVEQFDWEKTAMGIKAVLDGI
jgi:glycosyltransferase involved in cell wall biosynthesis